MSDDKLTIGAAFFELGLPVVLVWLCFRYESRRRLLVPIIGAITPLLLFLVVGSVVEFLSSEAQSSMWWAVFLMSLFVYLLLALVGLVLGVVLTPSVGLRKRFGCALFIGPVCALGFLFLESNMV